mmetsp:Transcript_27808/g.54667  ORF Transcript_27808/g.54667 Transcript_27808/m.54667 type:complete len:82 (-) Transcript_27808:1539-1784(-)
MQHSFPKEFPLTLKLLMAQESAAAWDGLKPMTLPLPTRQPVLVVLQVQLDAQQWEHQLREGKQPRKGCAETTEIGKLGILL